jgi:hypothetical protein
MPKASRTKTSTFEIVIQLFEQNLDCFVQFSDRVEAGVPHWAGATIPLYDRLTGGFRLAPATEHFDAD